jgi:hypothetical protein
VKLVSVLIERTEGHEGMVVAKLSYSLICGVMDRR